jgi:hypothetical protein
MMTHDVHAGKDALLCIFGLHALMTSQTSKLFMEAVSLNLLKGCILVPIVTSE